MDGNPILGRNTYIYNIVTCIVVNKSQSCKIDKTNSILFTWILQKQILFDVVPMEGFLHIKASTDIQVNPLNAKPKITQARVYGKCVLYQNKIVSKDIPVMKFLTIHFYIS